jgi:Glycosyl transferases group 1
MSQSTLLSRCSRVGLPPPESKSESRGRFRGAGPTHRSSTQRPTCLSVTRRRVDILHISSETTFGWTVNDAALRRALTELGVDVHHVSLRHRRGGLITQTAQRLRSPVTDLYESAAFVALTTGALRHVRPRAIIYSCSQAALLQPRRTIPEAVWIDGSLAVTRPGKRDVPLRTLERVRQRRLDLAMAMSLRHADEITSPLRARESIILHAPVDRSSGPSNPLVDRLPQPFGAIYAGDPFKKGLDVAIEAWSLTGTTATLVISGITHAQATEYLGRALPANVRAIGPRAREVHRSLVRKAAVYVSASHREEYGTSQLEAYADLVPVAAVPSLGLVEPVAVGRAVKPELIASEISAPALARVIIAALRMTPTELDAYRAAAATVMADYSYRAFKARLAHDVLPRLLS